MKAAYRIDGREVSPEAFYAVACDPARSVAVEACAGAGKTWMLVARMLRALLDGCLPQDILAITFTKKAAGEMRERLDGLLRGCAAMSTPQRIEALCQRGLPPDAARRLEPVLAGLHARLLAEGRPVQVRTFHSWFAALLRGAPLSVLQELDLPPRYELLEDDQPAIERVWPRFHAALAASPADRQDFFDLVARHGRSQTRKALTQALARRVEFALADAAGVVDRSVQAFDEAFPRLHGLERPEHALLTPAARQRWQAWAATLGQHKNKTPVKAAQVIIDAFLLPDEPGQMAERLQRLRDVFFVKDEDRLTKNLKDVPEAQQAEPELQELCAAVRQHAAWEHHQRMARQVRLLLRCFAEFKREQGWVDMNDVEGAARRLLGDAELSGWLQQRLDARLRHVLIDEFQDTNPLQWQALYGWLSGYAGAGPGEAPSVFLVGDPKQSIYRFRRAEPQVFRAAQAFVVQGLDGALLSCDHTRRCAPAVVDALNAVMQAAEAAGEYGEAVGAAFRPHTTGSTADGAVLLLPPVQVDEASEGAGLDTGTDTDKEGTGWRDSLTQPRHEPEETRAALEARQAADWIAAELARGAIQPGDVMVLARKRERLGWLYEALRERGIAADQPAKEDLADAPAVQDVVALLDALVSTDHDLSLARALRSPILGWDDAGLAAVARAVRRRRPPADQGQPPLPAPAWWDVLQTDPPDDAPDDLRTRWRDTSALLRRWQGLVQQLPPHDALSAIYGDADLLARYAASVPVPQRASVLAQLRELLMLSLDIEGGRFLTPYRWVRALKAGQLAAPQAQPAHAVRLLTIHGAKGLEAPVVMLIDTQSAGGRPESMGVLVDWPGEAAVPRRFVFLVSERQPPACAAVALDIERQARSLEELNALYVAMTRAEHRLVVSSFVPGRSSSATTWFQRLQPHALAVDAPGASTLSSAAVAGSTPGHCELPGLPVWSGVRAPGGPVRAPARGSEGDEDDTQARLGLALHRLLQWCPTPLAGFDWHDGHRVAVAREFDLSLAQSAEVLASARRIVRGEAAWAWDAGRVDSARNEVELFHQGELLRLDRLVRETATGTWWVLDHKSAQRPDLDPALQAQLRRYAQAVRAARPGEPVRMAFINSLGRLIELTDDHPHP